MQHLHNYNKTFSRVIIAMLPFQNRMKQNRLSVEDRTTSFCDNAKKIPWYL